MQIIKNNRSVCITGISTNWPFHGSLFCWERFLDRFACAMMN